MGVHGLTTFIEGIQKNKKGTYREKIIIRSGPVVIDGCNLMYHLYFDGPTPIVGKGPNKAITDLTAKKVPDAHLYGGDWSQYAQNVRYFFQQLKHCNITAIVIFDGAYDQDKLEIARRRFNKSVRDNVKNNAPHKDAIEMPGKTYTPVFLKSVFLEVLVEQKVPHYQTLGEADPTIAWLAKLLGNCPILSSDSDFYIYSDATPVKLKSLKFSLKQIKADLLLEDTDGKQTGKSTPKVWTLEGEYVSLKKICKQEFGLNNPDMFPLAALIIGNDSIVATFLHQFKQGDTIQKRIECVFKWLSRQRTVGIAFQSLLAAVPVEKRRVVSGAMRYNLELYKGENGEKRIWDLIKAEVDVSAWIDKAMEKRVVAKIAQESKADGTENVTLRMGNEGIKCTVREQPDGSNMEVEGTKISADNNGNLCAELLTRSVPEWYRIKHEKCELQTYLLNIIKNQVVFLPPQVEKYNAHGTHTLSIPIIKITAGILHGDDDMEIALETHMNGRTVRCMMHPLLELEHFGLLPVLRTGREQASSGEATSLQTDLSKCYTHEYRLSLMLAALGICEKKGSVCFYDGWPAASRIWIGTLMYFLQKKFSVAMAGEPEEQVRALAVVTSIFLCIIKNLIVNPGKMVATPGNKCLAAISALLEATNSDPSKLQKIRDFYKKFEDGFEGEKLDYEIEFPYSICQYMNIVYHTEMLNNLLGNPMKSPKVRYTFNNYFAYNFARYILEEVHTREEGCEYNDIIKDATGVDEIGEVLLEFLGVCYTIGKMVRFKLDV